MMLRSNGCPKCQGSMTEGFTLENNGSARVVCTWIEGQPEKGLFGIKLRGRTQREIQTWRCGRCGYLENYAKG
jgi:ribosomal protein S27AE